MTRLPSGSRRSSSASGPRRRAGVGRAASGSRAGSWSGRGHHLAAALEVDSDDLLRAPVREPETVLVPSRRLADREAGQQGLRFGHSRFLEPPTSAHRTYPRWRPSSRPLPAVSDERSLCSRSDLTSGPIPSRLGSRRAGILRRSPSGVRIGDGAVVRLRPLLQARGIVVSVLLVSRSTIPSGPQPTQEFTQVHKPPV